MGIRKNKNLEIIGWSNTKLSDHPQKNCVADIKENY